MTNKTPHHQRFRSLPHSRAMAIALFQKPDHRRDRMLRRNRDAHMHMVWHQVPLDNLALLLPSQRMDNRAQLLPRLAEDGFPPAFGYEHNMILAVPF
jgi:hypothetical protein